MPAAGNFREDNCNPFPMGQALNCPAQDCPEYIILKLYLIFKDKISRLVCITVGLDNSVQSTDLCTVATL